MTEWYMGVPMARGVLNVIGQCDPESEHQSLNLWPIPYGSVGHHLWQLFVTGDRTGGGNNFTRTNYIEVTSRHGLCDGDEFDHDVAARNARKMEARGLFDKPTLLLGRVVAETVLPMVNWGGCPSRFGNFYYIANPTHNNRAYENKSFYKLTAQTCADALRLALKIEAEKSGWVFYDDGRSEYVIPEKKNVR